MRKRTLSPKGRVLIGILALLTPVALGAAANSAHAVPVSQNWTVRVGSQTADMAVQGQRFLPGDITIDAGDSVTWKAKSAEIHTVTFFDGGTPQATVAPLNPPDPLQVTPQGPTTMDGTRLLQLRTVDHDVALHPDTRAGLQVLLADLPGHGELHYYCLVHGVMMRGAVHVQAASAPYPATQADIDAEAAWMAGAINRRRASLPGEHATPRARTTRCSPAPTTAARW